MSVINQVLQDLDARKTGRHGEDPVWAIEPPAIAEPPRRIPALTLTVPVVAIAVAALFGQGSWGWQTPDGRRHCRRSCNDARHDRRRAAAGGFGIPRIGTRRHSDDHCRAARLRAGRLSS